LANHPQFRAYLSLASVCFFWGTTYLGIRMALESFPPMTLIACRFLLSGSLMLLAAKAMGLQFPRGREFWRTALYGVIILGIGNGCLVTAETIIPSGLAALIITVAPFWMVGLNSVIAPKVPLHLPTLVGMAVGLCGAVILVGPSALQSGFSGDTVKGFLMLQVGCVSWSFGSLLQRRQPKQAGSIVSGAIQQMAAGVAFIIPAYLTGGSIHWSLRGGGAFFYLVIFGSIVGYTSYVYALEHLPVAVMSIYNYINPVVAVILGWIVYREPFGWREASAMAVIFAGVAMVRRAQSKVGAH
jgi:drug/metabolite transporter (DMT)-like permease